MRIRKVGVFVAALFVLSTTALAGITYYVAVNGSDANYGSLDRPWLTIQKAANTMQAGDTCIVNAGTYAEHVKTAAGGDDESHRITFKAHGVVTMRGFDVKHPYITIQGFDITGYTQAYQGHITIYSGGNYCHVFNNIVRDGAQDVSGIYFYSSGGLSASSCIVRGNLLSNLNYVFLPVRGENHLFENNIFERLNNRDYIFLFGHGHVFRRNIFRDGNIIEGVGNHPDWVQTFGDNGEASYDMLFEENWVENLECAIAQLNSGGGARGILTTIYGWKFRRNVFFNLLGNMNLSVPGMTFTNNTFYRFSYDQSGLYFGGSLTRGETSKLLFKNNALVAGGSKPNLVNDFRGYYAISGVQLTKEVILIFVTNDETSALAIINDLAANGYLVNSNGSLTAKAKSLTDISQFMIGDTYASHKDIVYDLLTRTVTLDNLVRNTTLADYNFVAGAGPEYAPKRSDSCTYGVFTPYNYCELNGINGGNPGFLYEANPLGADGQPFTSDDGFALAGNSILKDKGGFLTKAAVGGSGTVLEVENAQYFSDGLGVVEGDTIQLEGSIARARIIDIDYASNTITLDQSLSWNEGVGVSLPYEGLRPDIGAYEYGKEFENYSERPRAPIGLTVK